MNVINILNKSKADELSAMGFNYKEKKVQGKTIYEFIGTPDLMKAISGNFSTQDFFMSRTLNL